jgi:anti-sigma-K factor RskA
MDEQLHLLTGAYALNALDEQERSAFEQHALTSAASRDEVRELSETAALLAYGSPAVVPPPELKAKVMASVRNTRQLPSTAVRRDLDQARDRRQAGRTGSGSGSAVRWMALAAGVSLLGAAALGGWAANLASERDRTEQRLQALQQEQAAVMEVFTAKDARVIPASMADGATVTIAHSVAANRAAVITRDLPPLPADKGYELWVITASEARPAGMLPAGGGETAMKLLDSDLSGATHLGITVEPAGGSKQPTTDPILVQEL